MWGRVPYDCTHPTHEAGPDPAASSGTSLAGGGLPGAHGAGRVQLGQGKHLWAWSVCLLLPWGFRPTDPPCRLPHSCGLSPGLSAHSLPRRRLILAVGTVLCSFRSAAPVTTSVHHSPDNYLIDLAFFQLLAFSDRAARGTRVPTALRFWCPGRQFSRVGPHPEGWTRRRFPEAWGGSYNTLKPARLL